MVLDTDEVLQRFAAKEAVLLRADMTDKNLPAQALLDQLGGKAIPFLAVFCGDKPDKPYVLEGTYTKSDLFKILDECPAPGKSAATVGDPAAHRANSRQPYSSDAVQAL